MNAIKGIEKAEVKGQTALVRVDYNSEPDLLSKNGNNFKIITSKKTIDFLCGNGATVVLLTHFGRPEAKDPEYSTEKLLPFIEKDLGRHVHFISDCIGEKVTRALQALHQGEVLLLENVRYRYSQEKANDRKFAEELAKPFSLFVNEAFSNSHRAHASMSAITHFLPSYAGFRLLKEIEELNRIRLLPEHPAVAIIGGAKIETKLPLIQALELNYDAIVVGGKIANEALDRGERFSEKVHLPVDFDSPERFDIGPKTIENYRKIIREAKTIIWNGPMGKFEEAAHSRGTQAILEAVLASGAFSVMGGGESLDILEKSQSREKINFVSTGGGAMLEYMSGKHLPAITALENAKSA